MKTRVLLGLVLPILLGLGAAAPSAHAEPQAAPPPPPPIQGPAGTPEAMRREILERLAAERAWKLVEGLKLDQATSAKIFPVLTKYDELFFSLFGERRELGRQMRAELAATVHQDARLIALVDKLVALRARRHALESERLTELRKVLTPIQQAKLLTLLPQIEGGFLRRIRHARGNDGGPDGGERSGNHGPGDGFGPEDPF